MFTYVLPRRRCTVQMEKEDVETGSGDRVEMDRAGSELKQAHKMQGNLFT